MLQRKVNMWAVGSFVALILMSFSAAVQSQQTKPVTQEIRTAKNVNPELQVLSSYIKTRNAKMSSAVADSISDSIIRESNKTNLPVELIVGIVEAESTFNPKASSKGAKGLMQIKKGDKVKVDHGRASNISYNVGTGCKILIEKLKTTDGELHEALGKYSGGSKTYPNRVLTCIGRYAMHKDKDKISRASETKTM